MDHLFYEFCGNESFLNESLLYQEIPTLTNCFLDTLPVWISCGYLLIVSVPFTVFLVRTRQTALPHSPLHILKLVTCVLLACFAQLHFTFRQMYGDGCAGTQVLSNSGYTAVWIKFVTFLCAGALLHVQKTCGNRTSGLPFTFWLLILVTESCRLYSYLLENVVCGTQVVFYVYYSCIVMQLVLYCWAEKQPGLNPNKIPCPMDSASVLNRIFYHWLTTTIYSVYKQRFSRDKMWLQTVLLRSSIIGPRLYQIWQTRLRAYLRLSFRAKKLPVRSKENDDMSTSFTESTPLLNCDQESLQQRDGQNNAQKGRPSLLMTVLRTFIWELCEFVGYGVCSFCAWFLIPIILRQLLDYVEMKNSPDDDPTPGWVGVAYVVGLCIIIEMSSITSQTTLHHSTTFGLKVKSALMYVIYKKALSVARTQQTMSVGEISSLMSVDCQRIQDATMYIYYIVLFVPVIAAFTWQIIAIVGAAATIGGLLMLAAFVPLTVYIGYRQTLLQSDILFLKGLRIRVINEVLTGIKVLKMYAWEPTFQQKIEDIRLKETNLLRKNTILLAIVSTLANHAQYMVHFVMITVYVVQSADHFISSTVVFVSLSLVILIKYNVSWLPTVLSGAVQVIVLEASHRVGGWMNTVKTGDGAHFELGPHSIRPVGPQGKNTLQLADAIGLADDVIGVPATNKEAKNRYLYVNGGIHALPNADKFMSFFKKSPPFSKSIFSYMQKERRTKGDVKDDETIYDFFARRFGPDVAEYGVDAFCRGIFAGDIRKLSIKSCFPPIYNLEKDHGGIIRGMQIKFIKGLSNTKKPAEVEELCNLCKKALSERWTTYTFRHGCQQLPDRLHKVLSSKPDVDIHMNTPCSSVRFSDNSVEVTVNGEVIKADHVVSSIFAKDTASLLEGGSNMGDISADLKRIPGVDVAVVCLEYEGTGLINKPGFGHLLPSCEDPKVLGVIYDSCMFPQLDAPNKQTTRLTAMMGGAWYADLEEAVPSMSEAELGQFAAQHVSRQLGIQQDPTKVFVGKHTECIPQYVLGHSECIERIFGEIKERRLPLSLVGSSYKGPSINDCINNTRIEIEEAAASLRRIEEFLCCPDLDDKSVTSVKTSEYSIQVTDGYFVWDRNDTEPDLKRINLTIRPGQLVAVVGPCASGKSSLAHCLLGDITKLSGKVNIKGTVSYVPQEAWIQNMTLRENIIFGQEYNSKRYWKVIEQCALKSDLTLLEGGDKTEIGEKGTNISGGQKQRISLARAVYHNSDIYILDDPLSAVDSNVGKNLFNNVIGNSGLLKQKTRVLVTHAIHWLPLVDNIIVMNQGTITESGTYDELMTHNGPFAQFLLQHFNEEPAHELDDPELQWIRNNIREQVDSLTSDGASSDSHSPLRLKHRRQKKRKQKRRYLSSLSLTHSLNAMTSQHMSMMVGYTHAQLTTDETIKEGAVEPGVFLDYVKAMGLIPVSLSLLALVLDQIVTVYSMFWLTDWTEDPFLKNRTNSGTPDYTNTAYTYLVGYAVMGGIQIVLMYISLHLALTRQVQAASVLHRRMLTCILRSPMSFFNTVPVGRMLNRFSTDIDNIDNRFPESYRVFSISVLGTLSAIVTMVISTPAFGYIIAPALVGLCLLMMFYLPTLRKMRRLEAVTRSPIFNHFSETLTGSSIIRAFRSCSRFVREATHRLDNNTRFSFAVNSGYRWIGTRLELLATAVLLISLLISVTSGTMSGANLGLSINYAVQLTFQLNAITWGVAETEMTGVSVERVQEYTTLDTEADWYENNIAPDPDWPTSGSLQFIDYTCRYRPELEPVLKAISCHIQHGEKIGVVGRTGAGKSSLALALFRIIEACSGTILLDGLNIADIGLHTLRTQITILAQDPVLFCGTLRMNVDPTGNHADEDIWTALSWAHLKTFVQGEPAGLDYQCDEAGQNLSVGQRQLVCLARALLHKTNILILDEATAAVDMETDLLIQNTIRSQFTDCTILAVAHRLNTVIDYDRVMVLDQGRIVEFATPRELLKNKDGHFYMMARDAGIVQ